MYSILFGVFCGGYGLYILFRKRISLASRPPRYTINITHPIAVNIMGVSYLIGAFIVLFPILFKLPESDILFGFHFAGGLVALFGSLLSIFLHLLITGFESLRNPEKPKRKRKPKTGEY